MIATIIRNGGIDIPRSAVEKRCRTTIWSARRKDPVEGCQLATIIPENCLRLCKLLHGSVRLAVITQHRVIFAFRIAVEIGVRGIEVDGTEKMKVARIW